LQNQVGFDPIPCGAGKTTEFAKERTMSSSGAKSHHFIMTALLVSALTLCWSAEAKPPKGGSKPLVTQAMRDVILKKIRGSTGTVCLVFNPDVPRDMCVVFESYNGATWGFGFSPRTWRTQQSLTGYEMREFARAPQGATLYCKVVYAWYGPPYKGLSGSGLCPWRNF
jgi:hypothetical protein